ncbi:hypothetical protein GCM10027070_25490 [Barrientosiimonas humi]
MPAPEPAFVVSSTAEFGAGLRALRGRLGLRKLAHRQTAEHARLYLSHAQLSRYERGEVLPPLERADHLDWLYDGQGWVAVNIRNLWRSGWDPWKSHNAGPARVHAIRWPAPYEGAVWLKLRPAAAHCDESHHVTLAWGSWRRTVDVTLPPEGALLFTGKAADEDGRAVACNITCDPRAFLLYGSGDEFEDEAVTLDLRQGWTHAPGETTDS